MESNNILFVPCGPDPTVFKSLVDNTNFKNKSNVKVISVEVIDGVDIAIVDFADLPLTAIFNLAFLFGLEVQRLRDENPSQGW